MNKIDKIVDDRFLICKDSLEKVKQNVEKQLEKIDDKKGDNAEASVVYPAPLFISFLNLE